MFLLSGESPIYPSVLHCSLLRHFVLAFFQSAGLITVPITIDHIFVVFRKKQLEFSKMVAIQGCITFLEVIRLSYT